MSVNDNRRYYWLRLKEDFFDSKRIKKLRNLSSDFVIIYLKLQLKALQSEGKLYYSGLEDTFAKELALDLDEDSDKVQITLSYLQSCGLLESNAPDVVFFPYVAELTGSETNAASRMRYKRSIDVEVQKSMEIPRFGEQCSPLDEQCSQHSEKCSQEIEKDIEKDIYKEKEIAKEKEVAVVHPSSFESLINQFSDNAELRDVLNKYVEHRKTMRGGFTLCDMEQSLNDLKQLSKDTAEQIAIVNQSLAKNWKGLFSLKGVPKNRMIERVPSYEEIKDKKPSQELIDKVHEQLKRRKERLGE